MMSAEATASPSRRASRWQSAWDSTSRFRPVLALDILLLIVFAATQSRFLRIDNLQNMLTSVSILWVIAMGMTFVLLSGGFDLSVAAIAALSGIFFAKIAGHGLPGGLIVVLTILFGAGIGGLINGVLIGPLGLSVFVVTLASLTALSGIDYLWSHVDSFYVTTPVVSQISIDSILGVPTLIWIMVGTLLAFLYVQTRTYFGRDVYAIGGSIVAARLSGIRTSAVLIAVYAISGACAALGGVMAIGRTGAATPDVDANLPLQAIAAVLLGGTALTGGAGGVLGTAAGVLFIGILDNGLSLAGISSFWQNIITGVILVAAVLGDRVHFRRRIRPTSDVTDAQTAA
jgi:ribose transport system permease protein